VRFEAVTVALLKIQALWDVMLWQWVFSDVSKYYIAFIFRVKQYKK
jgi:hypothetical protein